MSLRGKLLAAGALGAGVALLACTPASAQEAEVLAEDVQTNLDNVFVLLSAVLVIFTEVRGFGRQGGHTETYRGTEYAVDLLPKLRLEVLCSADETEKVMELIRASAHTGTIGEGKIWVTDVDRLMRIRTGDLGTDAI